MSMIFLMLILLVSVISQDSLLPMNRCLGNCAICKNDELSTCSGKQLIECVKGYNDQNCTVKQTIGTQLILLDSTKPDFSTKVWKSTSVTECWYTNSKMQQTKTNILGMYRQFDSNTATLPIQPYYSHFILSFNLIRSSWTPFSDLVKISILDQAQVQLSEHYIEFPRRDQINPDINLMRCKNLPYLIEKYQVQELLDPTKQKSLSFLFEGMMFSSDAEWGITNIKVIFGCSKFLIYDGTDCQKCGQGFYALRNANKAIEGCQSCPLNCIKCTDASNCQSCIDGYSLSAGKCTNSFNTTTLVVPGINLICSKLTLLPSSPSGTQQKLDFILKSLPPHNKTRLIFNIAFTPTQYSTKDKIVIALDGKDQVTLSGQQLISYNSKPKEVCKQFGKDGYFTLIKVITPYIVRKGENLTVTITSNPNAKLGVYQINFQYQPYIEPPKPQPPKPELPKAQPNNGTSKAEINPNPTPTPTPNQTLSNQTLPTQSSTSPTFPAIPTTPAPLPSSTNASNAIPSTTPSVPSTIPPTVPSANTSIVPPTIAPVTPSPSPLIPPTVPSPSPGSPTNSSVQIPKNGSVNGPVNNPGSNASIGGTNGSGVQNKTSVQKNNTTSEKPVPVPVPVNNNTSPIPNNTNPTPNIKQNNSNVVDKDKLEPKPVPYPNTISNDSNANTNTNNNVNNNNNTNNNNETSPKQNNTANTEQPKQNNTNTPNSQGSGAQAAKMAEQMQKIEKVKDQIQFGLKRDKKLIITVNYPIQLETKPYISAHLNKKNITMLPQVTYQTSQYQQLTFHLGESLLDETIQFFMSEQNPIQVARRGLQAQTKINLGQIKVSRFDYLSATQWDSINRYSVYFQVVAWFTIVSTILFTFLGNSVITQKMSLLLQIIFLHVYIYSEYLPINFKSTIAGLQRIENLDYFSKEAANEIQKFLLGNVIQLSPSKFTMFNKDINFTRAIYPSIIIILTYLVWFGLINLIRKKIETGLVVSGVDQERTKGERFKLFVIRTAERILNFWYQVWQYMYIVFVWAGCVQMHNLAYPLGSDRSQIPNIIFCFACLIIVVILPIGTLLYLNKKYFRLDYFYYSYWYQNIFFLKLPEQSLPSNHHRILILVRNLRYILLVICFGFLGNYPIQALVIIIAVHFTSLLYSKITHVQIKAFNSKINIIQHLLLIALAICMIVAYGTSKIFSTQQYLVIGHVLTTICLLLTIVGLVRIFYYLYYKLNDRITEKELSEFKPAIGTQRIV